MLLSFDTTCGDSAKRVSEEFTEMAVAGWVGRDRTAIEHHIEELAAIGVAPPSEVPLFYRASASSLTQAERIEVVGNFTSGEVEPFMFSHEGQLYITVASDHTDRKLEAHSVALSKQICAKPLGRECWLWDDVREHWDQIILRSWIEGEKCVEQYQEGLAGLLLSPEELLYRYLGERDLPTGLGMLCGTVAVMGSIRPATGMRIALYDPVLNRQIEHRYQIDALPEVN